MRCSVSPMARASLVCISMQYAQPLSCEARMRTSSRSLGSNSTRSSSLVAALSRWLIAREKPAACASKSSRTGISVVFSVVVMSFNLWGDRPRVRSNSMADTWATSGIDLHLDLTGRRVRAGLEDALREAIATGRLLPSTALPSSRALARDLGIARNTVAEAYGQLVAEGWLTAQRGSGTRVADRRTPAAALPPAATAELARPRYNLRPGSPDLSAFPRQEWLAAARRALAGAPAVALGYGDPRGRPELRLALADYLARARGVRVTADRIVVCSGFTQGLGLLCQVLRARGASVLATEEYSLASHRDVINAHGLQRISLPVDRDGATVGGLGDADAALLTPAHQFPLGVALSAQRRSQLLDWAERTGGLVIEDDYDGEFRYDRQPVGAMQALAPERIVYTGTASKSLAPGLRLGWLVLPAYRLARSSSSPWPNSSAAVPMTDTYGAPDWPIGAAATGCSPRCSAALQRYGLPASPP